MRRIADVAQQVRREEARASMVLMTMLERFARSISPEESSVNIVVTTKPGDN